jgi:hypothetical protein
MNRHHVASILIAIAMPASFGNAPTAAAADEPGETNRPPAPSQSCTQLGAAEFRCESPGDAQLNDAAPITNFFPQEDN